MTRYEFVFKNHDKVKFDFEKNIDFATIDPTKPLTFDDLFINMTEVTVIMKVKEADNETN